MKIIAGVHAELRRRDAHRRPAGPFPLRPRRAGRRHRHGPPGAVDRAVAERWRRTCSSATSRSTAPGVVRWRAMAREAQDASAAARDRRRSRPGVRPRCRSGLQQLVELGRVLFSGARIIILDEPTSALSPPEIERLFAVLRRLKAEGTSFIFISHFLEDVLEVSDRVTVFRNSRRIATETGGRGRQALGDRADDRPRPPGARGGARGRGGRWPATRGAPVVLEARGLGRKGAFADVSLDRTRRRGARASTASWARASSRSPAR